MKTWIAVWGMSLLCLRLLGQYPAYFNYTIENGGPSNEVYSIIQDKQGTIWIGCDAGLFRYNGVYFEQLSNPKLSTRSVTGLCEASDGTIYAYNFNGQILIIKNNKLEILEGWDHHVNRLSADSRGSIWISSENGIVRLNEKTLQWNSLADLDCNGKTDSMIHTSGVIAQKNGNLYYLFEGKLAERRKGKYVVHPINPEQPTIPSFLCETENRPWVLGLVNGDCYVPQGKNYVRKSYGNLSRILTGKKLTNVQEIDEDIWISTHSGIIRFNKQTQKTTLFYPNMAFSACLLDKEGSYWFTTLHDGILRMPNLDYLCWNKLTGIPGNDQFSHVVRGDNRIFFATTDGTLGETGNGTDGFVRIDHSIRSDVGAMYYDAVDNCVYFNKMNTVFSYCNRKITLVNSLTRPIKDFCRIGNEYLVASSQGTYLYTLPYKGFREQSCILQDWSRQLIRSPFSNSVFVATNHGLIELMRIHGKWSKKRVLFPNRQITSITRDSKQIYLLTFDGKIYSLSETGVCKLIMKLSQNIRAVQLNCYKEKLFISSNTGLILFFLRTGSKVVIDRYSGLYSNNVNGCAIIHNSCWVSTGNGLHQLPLSGITKHYARGKIILREILVNGRCRNASRVLSLNYSDDLKIRAEGLCYRSNSNFNFAYRFLGDKTEWISVPASVREITIPHLPTGDVTMVLKITDHENRSSINTLRIKLYVRPPFWQRWWFYVLGSGLIIGISYLIFKRRIKQLRRKQVLHLKQLQLENELRFTQQNALKAQMNPHFLFNVLNSIKGFIYENDKKNAARYLGDFSSLVRKILEMSTLSDVSLTDELETLNLYINLESMLLEDDFALRFEIDPLLDLDAVRIPALLLQPYVENAFKHGLRHKKGLKKLQIRVREDRESNLLIIEIEDNGIGRAAASEINNRQRITHESFATGANAKRIDLLNFERSGIIGVEITDLTPGTKVTIRIHL